MHPTKLYFFQEYEKRRASDLWDKWYHRNIMPKLMGGVGGTASGVFTVPKGGTYQVSSSVGLAKSSPGGSGGAGGAAGSIIVKYGSK